MREDNIERLRSSVIKKRHPHYIHLSYLVKDIKKAVEENASGDVLDIGCGNKPYESYFSQKVLSYTGCDVVQSSDAKVDVICEATSLAFEDNRFDTVFSTQVIEHVSDPQAMLHEAFRVMKNGGKLILSFPFAWELHEEPYDFFRYTKYGIAALLKNAGFEIEEVKPNGGKWAAVFQLQLNMLYSSFLKKGVFRKMLKGFFVTLRFTVVYNSIAVWLDKKFFDPVLTLNYVVVARKK
ncbi:MAG TPA: methyltransferase domain-containing protein [Chitinophagaceae bacterium]|nr:methyltransferase domain-containing protein [Chitinophagaceae bacterium]